MAEAFSSVIQKLDSWRVESLDSENEHLHGGIEGLTNELRMMVDFLRGKKLEEGSRLNYFICDAIEMAHDALDTKDNDQTVESNVFTIHYYLSYTRSCMLQLKESPIIRSENTGEGDDDGDVVGLDEDVELLLHREILDDTQSLKALLISGMSGVGKTTLARKLHNHADVVDRFERRAWVCVSNLSYKEVLMKLIQQVVDSGHELLERDSLLEKMEHADIPSLQQMLRQHLQEMKYFIVLDDVTREMDLKFFLKALPCEDQNERRLLLTSCSKDIEWSLRFLPFFNYGMKTLDSKKSWQLFLKTMLCDNKFTSEDTFPKHLERNGREVLMETCGGLPLAIKEVGRQLAEKRLSGCEWGDLFESINLDSTLELMESSYQKLNPGERSCFLHLAFFKVDATIRREKLMHILVATGLVSPKKNISYYVSCLSTESIIEVMYVSQLFGTKSLHVNTILHMLSIKKAEEEFGFEILSNDGITRPSQIPLHRVICCSRDKFNYSTNQDKHLVSLLFHGGGYFDSSPSYWDGLEQLRILDLEDFGLKVLPESIGMLKELRYLGLRNNYIQELPNSLGCLKKLEVLDIALNFMVEVPNIIWEMEGLLHVYASNVICRLPLKIDARQNLKTLTYISADNWTYELSGLQMMTSLCNLGIENFVNGNSDVSKLLVSLAELRNLDHLMLRGSRFRSMPCLDQLYTLHNVTELSLDGHLAELPSADSFPPYIKTLRLVNSCLVEDPMPVLGKLPKLMLLKLRNTYTGQQMVIFLHGGFPSLVYLGIEQMRNLRNVKVGKDALPLLRKLEIKNCPRLETLPKDVGSLEELKMVTTKRIATKIRKSGSIPDFIKHVDIRP